MSEHKRLHPISAVASFVKQLKDLIVPFVFLFVINNRGEKNGFWDYMPLLSMALVLVIVLVFGIIKWLRFTYRLESGELRIEYGLFVKKKRYIPIERIQSLNFSEGILHRPFGLVKVKVETAGSSSSRESEAELTAISKEEALDLEQMIYREKKGESMTEDSSLEQAAIQEDEPFFTLGQKDIWVLAATSGGVGVIISGVALFLSQFNELIPYKAVYEEVAVFIKSGVFIVALTAFLGLVLAWFLSIVWTFIIYGDFKIRIVDEHIVMTRGLLEKKQVTVPLNRVQGIRVVENPIRQLIGYCTVHIENAGGSVLEKDSTSIKLFPIIKKEQVPELLNGLFPEYIIQDDFSGLPVSAMRRYVFRQSVWVLVPAAAACYFFWPYGLWAALLILPFGVLGYYQYRAGGFRIDGGQLSLRYRGVLKNTMYMKKNRIQSLDTKESWFQERKGLGSLTTTVKSGAAGYASQVRDLKKEDLKRIVSWFSHGI
ncbi:PH domain-containing protein [Rossellomorea vietnamensis]|uniref:PH domain-containing protein n=1 Tax=Rossellomorea vietnamensis TaxID=218284 RepID=UPI001E450F63|nr:PH domain-containing protein [Rossellomorea vietnamensis]MCC5803992.1 PH domain-containing protein [Rossellomorea vietnamensis]